MAIVLVWGNLPTHLSRAMRQLIAARTWLPVYQLTVYAPELNPVEAVWSNLKKSLANLTKQGLDQLAATVKTRLKQMQYRPVSPTASSPRPGLTSHSRNLRN
jgi:putative transposase